MRRKTGEETYRGDGIDRCEAATDNSKSWMEMVVLCPGPDDRARHRDRERCSPSIRVDFDFTEASLALNDA